MFFMIFATFNPEILLENRNKRITYIYSKYFAKFSPLVFLITSEQ